MRLNELNQEPANITEYPQDIAEALVRLIEEFEGIEDKEAITQELADGIYYVRTCAENRLNNDYFRVLYSILARLAYHYD